MCETQEGMISLGLPSATKAKKHILLTTPGKLGASAESENCSPKLPQLCGLYTGYLMDTFLPC